MLTTIGTDFLFYDSFGIVRRRTEIVSMLADLTIVGRISHPDAPEQKLAGVVGILTLCCLTNELSFISNLQPVYAPSAVSARGGKFRFLPGAPGYVTVGKITLLYCLGYPLR